VASKLTAHLLACALLFLHASARAAEDDFQIWPVVTLHHGLSDHWGAHIQTRVRFDEDVSRTKDLLVRTFGSWTNLKSLTFDLGYDYVHSFHAASEHRAWQAGEHKLRWGDFAVKNRIRLDQRLVEDVDGVVLRFRYRLRGTHPIAGSGWYGVLSDEAFANLNDRSAGPVSGFEQNRLRAAVGVRFLGRVRAESGYEWQYAERRDARAVNRHVFFVSFFVDTGGRAGAEKSPP
jgi:hypothetical protein